MTDEEGLKMDLTREQRQLAREFFEKNGLAPPYDHELDALAEILQSRAASPHLAPDDGVADVAEQLLIRAANDIGESQWQSLPIQMKEIAEC